MAMANGRTIFGEEHVHFAHFFLSVKRRQQGALGDVCCPSLLSLQGQQERERETEILTKKTETKGQRKKS